MFQWLWDRVAGHVIDSAIKQLNDAEVWNKTIFPIVDKLVDREIERFKDQGLKNAIPKFELKDILGLVAMRMFGGADFNNLLNPQGKSLNSSSPNKLLEVK